MHTSSLPATGFLQLNRYRQAGRAAILSLIRDNSSVALRQLVDQALRSQKIGFEQRHGVSAQPTVQGDGLEDGVVPEDDDFRGLIADLLDIVSEALLDEADIVGAEFVHLRPRMR